MKLEREVERFCELQLARGVYPGTVCRYRRDLTRLRAFLGRRGKADLREATEEDIAEYLLWLEGEGYRKTTVTQVFWRLRKLFGHLQRGAVLLENPASELNRKRYPSRMRDWLSDEEVEKLLAVPDTTTAIGIRDRSILEVLYSCGLRLGELIALELDDVDLGDRLVTIKASKNGCFRRVPIGREAVRWVGRYLAEVRSRLLARRDLGIPPSSRLFLTAAGTPLTKGVAGNAFHVYATRTGIAKTITPHVLRHSFAVHLLKNGASTRHIQALLGHKHLESTQVYTQLLPSELKRVHRRTHPAERGRPKRPG